MKFWKIKYLEAVVKTDIPDLPVRVRSSIRRTIEERLSVDPVGLGKPLRYSLKGHRRLRVGDYRIVYRVELENHVVLVVGIKHRKDIYDD